MKFSAGCEAAVFLSANALKTAAFRQQMKHNAFEMPCSHETHGFSRGILEAFHAVLY